MNKGRYVLIIVFFCISVMQASSQVPFTDDEMSSGFTRGLELYNKEKYPAAIRFFDAFIRNSDGIDRITIAEAHYYSAMAAVNVFNPDAEFRMISYIRTYPESPRINDSYLALADYFYQNKSYRKAVTYYEEVNRQELSHEKLPEYFFRLGYSLYIRGDKPRALLMFSEIKDVDTEYTPPALYYFSHIAYEQKMYQTAMDGFMRLRDDETFGAVVPFYIVQMLYLQKDYDRILEMAPGLLTNAPKERAVEMYRFIGDAYYNKENYAEALPFLENFASGTKISAREDKYQLGYCYYRTGDIDKAIKILLEISSGSDLLSQNIWYVLGDCYLQKGDKKRAQFGFSQASKLTHDKKIREDALFNYAKLTYETSNSPFGEVITAFREYVDTYPGSERIEEAYDYLVSTYMQIKNYRAALESLERVRTRSSKLEEAYQRVAFFRGLELFKNLDFEAAADMFDKSLAYGKYNRQFMARAIYWRGEAFYRLGRFEDAKADYMTFMGVPGSMLLSEYKLVRYNLGYSLFNMKDYPGSLTHFKSFENDVANVSPELMADARNRIADCYYITTSYPSAITYYDKVIDFGKVNADYAMFQKGFSLGLMNDQAGKADVLSTLTTRYLTSAYLPNAIYERGRAYLIREEHSMAESDFNTIIYSYPSSPFVPRAMVQLGILYYNTGQNAKAVSQYKKVIGNFKATPEARDAMTGLKTTYVEMNDVEAYFAYVKSLQGYGDVNLAEKDSMLYFSGENLIIAGNYDRATTIFNNYITEFPSGSFLKNAQFYLAECYKYSKNDEAALSLYVKVASAPNSQFTEQSLMMAANIYFDKEEFESSLEYYEKLEDAAGSTEVKLTSLKGQLRSAFELGDARKTITASGKIINGINIPEELLREALFVRAKANYSLNNFTEALSDFRKIATEVISAEGAESKYRVAEILFKDDQISESERIVNEFVGQNTPHQYWVARMFILLSDISVKQGDLIQAKATLQSLRDYYTIDNDGILDEVREKLSILNQNN